MKGTPMVNINQLREDLFARFHHELSALDGADVQSIAVFVHRKEARDGHPYLTLRLRVRRIERHFKEGPLDNPWAENQALPDGWDRKLKAASAP